MIVPTSQALDPSVPGLGTAMRRDALIELLAGHLPECRDGLEVVDARVVDVQYAPGRDARVLWKLNLHDRATGRTGRQLAYVKALRRDEPAPAEPRALVERYRTLRTQKGLEREVPLRTPWLHVCSSHVVVHAFPLDPILPTLLEVANPLATRDALHRAWHPRGVRVRRVRIDPLSYTPEARAALRYEVLAEDKETGLPELRRLVGKLDARRSPTRLFAGHWAVWRRTLGRVAVAPPAGYLAITRLSLQEFLTGTRLSDLAGTGAFIGHVRETARAIARVHSLTLPLLSTRGLEKEMAAAGRWIRVLSRLRPGRAAGIEAIGRRLHDELAARLRVAGTVHGDFHLANVLADEHGVTLIDWDQVAHGDPMVDVGRVLASLRVSSLRIHGTIDGFADVQEGFLSAYLDATHDDERRARLFEAIALLVAAAAPFRLQRDGWEQGAELMLDEVERTLDLSRRGRPHAVGVAPPPKDEVPFAERPSWAVDRPYAQALLVPVVQQAYGPDIEVTECVGSLAEQRRHRLHVRWIVKGFRGRERWRRSLHGIGFVDDSGRGRLRRLEIAAGALASHPDALQVPRPVGHLGPLSLLVLETRPGGARLRVVRPAAGLDVVQHAAVALARLHSVQMDLGKVREAGRLLRAVRRRVDRLVARHAQASAARGVLEKLEAALPCGPEGRAPIVVGLRARHLRIAEGRVALALCEDVLMGEPLVNAGELAAELSAAALDSGLDPSSSAGPFRRAYAEMAGCAESDVAAFEALGLLAMMCRRAVKCPDDDRVGAALAYAAWLIR